MLWRSESFYSKLSKKEEKIMIIQIKKLDPSAILPTRNNKGDAGYDLYYSGEKTYIYGGQRQLFKTNISIAIPENFYGRIAPRSGLAYKNGIDVLGGVVDSTYRGNIGVILINLNDDNESSMPFIVNHGDRIAQLIIEKYHDIEWQEVDQLEETARAAGGFGSSGT